MFWKSGLVGLDSGYSTIVRDLVTFQLPPQLAGVSNLAAIDIVLRGYQNTGASLAFRIDYLELLPVDGFRYLEEIGPGYAYNRRVIDDGINILLYEDNGSGTAKIPSWFGAGMPILLKPGIAQRIHFIQHSYTGDVAEIPRTMGIKIFYRPRRWSCAWSRVSMIQR